MKASFPSTLPRLPLLQRQRFSLTLACIAALAASAVPAAAQTLGLAPAEIRETFKPGEPVRFQLTVSNDGPAPVRLRASVTDLWYTETNEKIFGTPGSHPRSAANWIEFVPRDLLIASNSSGVINVMVTPPAAASGGYYAVLFVESTPQLEQSATSTSRAVYTNMRLGALVLLNAAGTETVAISVDAPRLTPPSSTDGLHLEIGVTNTGNTHTFPVARLALVDRATRRLIARAQADPKRLLPGQRDTIALDWSGSLPPGDYLGILTLVYGTDRVETREIPFTVAAPSQAAPASNR